MSGAFNSNDEDVASAFIRISRAIEQQPDHPEYWPEIGRPICVQYAKAMTADDWEAFSRSWSSRPVEWQYRAANFLAYCESIPAIYLLCEMLRMSKGDIFVRILESLAEFGPEVVNSQLSQHDRTRIKEMHQSSFGINKTVIANIIQYLKI